jgi:molecular chaperone DnaJ
MDTNKNYYEILGISYTATEKEVKKAYYNKAKIFHPDKNNKETDPVIFGEITEAYDILCSEQRKDYDLKSRFGSNYNEYYEFFDINIDYDFDKQKQQMEDFKKNEILNIQVEVDSSFNDVLEYERWVKCKTCDGTGKDLNSKIVIRDNNGNILKTFDADDGCDFCEGIGKDHRGNDCFFCFGKGKTGLNPCNNCKGEKRILGKQKLNIKLIGKETKIEAMGHFSKNEPGKVGYLIILKK